MAGIVDLKILLRSLSPELDDTDYVFCTVNGDYDQYADLEPLASFRESEGLSLVIPEKTAKDAGIRYEEVFGLISLKVNSSLNAVGLTAAVASKLASVGISANVIAAHFHDHILVPANQTKAALSALEELSASKSESQ